MTHSLQIRTTIIATLFILGTPFLVTANNECAFSRTLSLGDSGEDVRCLQVFLNAAGFEVAGSGVGSPGNETTTYGSLTEAAVLRWQQARGIAGANGNFGPASQIVYKNTAGNLAVATETGNENLDRILADLQQQLALGLSETNKPTPQVAGVSDTAAQTLSETMGTFAELVSDIQKLDEEMESVVHSGLRSDALNVRLNLYNGLFKLFSGEYNAAHRLARALIKDVEEIMDELEEVSESQSAADVIKDVRAAYRKADDRIEKAIDNDESGADNARDLLDEARDILSEARDALDEEDWDDAKEYALEAKDLIEEALDEL